MIGYFLKESEQALFEHHQEMLEKNTEKLQEYTEQSLEKMDRSQIVNLTRVTETFLKSLLANTSGDYTTSSNGLSLLEVPIALEKVNSKLKSPKKIKTPTTTNEIRSSPRLRK